MNLALTACLATLQACTNNPTIETKVQVVEKVTPVVVPCTVSVDRPVLPRVSDGRNAQERVARLLARDIEQRVYITVLEEGVKGCGGTINGK